jgi:hypothetical protein
MVAGFAIDGVQCTPNNLILSLSTVCNTAVVEGVSVFAVGADEDPAIARSSVERRHMHVLVDDDLVVSDPTGHRDAVLGQLL